MKRITRLLVLCLAVTVMSAGHLMAVTSAPGAGTAAVPFLKIAQGARPAAMGDAFTAISNDANAAFWNPAGLTQVEHPQITGMYDMYFQSMYFGMLGYAGKSEMLKGTLGAGLAYMDAGKSPATDINGADLGYNTKATDLLIVLSYARMVKTVSAGVSLKIINSTLGDEKTAYSPSTFALDLGGLYKFDKMPLSIGIAVQNLGAGIKYIEKSETLPLMVKIGAAYKINISGEKHKITPALDLVPVSDSGMKINLGGEYTWDYSNSFKFAGRLGYRGIGGVDNAALGGLSGITLGMGVNYASSYVLDFSFAPYGLLGNTIRVAFGYNFGK
jgi:hypothetical protein